MPIQKNASRTFRFRMVDSAGAGKAGTPSVVVSTGFGTAAAASNAPVSNSDLGVGCWRIVLTAAECLADDGAFVASLTGAVDWYQPIYFEGDYTSTRAGKIDNLDASVNSRGTSNYAGGAVASVTAGVTLAANQDVRNVTGALTPAERTAIADAVATELLTPNDGQQVIQAIVSAINAADVNLAGLSTATIAAAVRATLEGSGSFLALIKGKTDLLAFDGSGFVRAVEQHPLTDYQQRGQAVTLPTVTPATWRAVLAAAQPDYAPARPSDVSPTIQFSPTINPPAVTVNPALTGAQATTIANLDSLMESSGAGGHERFKATALEQAPAGGGGGSTPQAIWGYPYRSLTGLQVDGTPALLTTDAGQLAIVRGDTAYFDVPVGFDPVAATQVWVTLKADPTRQTDAQADLQATKTGGATFIGGAAPTNGATATISFLPGIVRVSLSAKAAALLPVANLFGDVQYADGGGDHTPVFFRLRVVRDVTQAT